MTDPTPLFPESGCALVSGGVGAEICRELAHDGCDVALTCFSSLPRPWPISPPAARFVSGKVINVDGGYHV